MSQLTILTGFLILFLIYQLAEAGGQDLLHFPGKPWSFFILFILVIPAAYWVAHSQGDSGLAAYGMGFHLGWWQLYLFGLVLGLVLQTLFEWVNIRLGIRRVSGLRFHWQTFLPGILWILVTNFPAAAGEDLITRGYLWRFMQAAPTLVFISFSALLYTLNHILRLLTRPVTDWYHLPFLGLTLAYALHQTGSLWFVIGLHQSGNVAYSMMRQLMDLNNTSDTHRRILFGIAAELITLGVIVLLIHFAGPLSFPR